MIGLLDTNAFLWLDKDPAQLSAAAAAFIQDPANEILISVVSAWELVIKIPTRKLILSEPVAAVVARQQTNGLRLIPVELKHTLAVEHLPAIHKDPFDRLLIGQAVVEGAAIVTRDAFFKKCPVPVIW